MRFMVMVKSDEKSESGVLPDEKILSAMGKYNQELITAGMMLEGDGLKASSHGSRVRISGKRVEVVDGPFAEAKELLGGFWVLEGKSKQQVIDWLKRAPFEEGTVELRPLYEAGDFPSDSADVGSPAAKAPARKPGTQRFMLLLKADQVTEAGVMRSKRLIAEMGNLMQELASSEALLSGEGLKPSSAGSRIVCSRGQSTVIDGPFTESKELIAGYSIIQVKSKQEAIEWGRRMLDIHLRGTGQTMGELEIRRLFELEDFPVHPQEKPDGWRARERAFRQQQGD